MNTNEKDWPRIAVVGAGAVGGYFGGMLARAGAPVVMIGRPPFVEAVRREGIFLDALKFQERIPVEASGEVGAASRAELVLFCVKTTSNVETARELKKALQPGASVLSMQNGVDNAEQIHAASGIAAIRSVVYVAASVPEPGRIKHVGRGDLAIGPRDAKTEWIAGVFERAGVPCRISENIGGDLWAKLMANCGLNAISALGRAKYGFIAASEDARKLVSTAVREVVAVAAAAGVDLGPLKDAEEAAGVALKVASQMTEAVSSTGQDLLLGKRTEIDSLNGFIARRGAELGVATPVNHALYTLVKLAEGRM